MLTMKDPVAMQSAKDITTIPSGFGERITANYEMMAGELKAEDLLYLTSANPEYFFMQEGGNVFQSQNEINQKQEVKLNIINNLVNRINVSADGELTYQDKVYITTYLNKIGITDVNQFIREVKDLHEDNQNIYDLLKLYWVHGEAVEHVIKEMGSRQEKNKEEKEEPVRLIENRLFLHQDIYNRLQTRHIYQELKNYQSRSMVFPNQMNHEEIKLANEQRIANLLFLSEVKQDIYGEQNQVLMQHHISHYELGEDAGKEVTKETMMQDAAAAVLVSLVDQVSVNLIGQSFHRSNQWQHIENAVYDTAENTIKQFEIYHAEKPPSYQEIKNYQTGLNQYYKDEIQQVRQFSDVFWNQYEPLSLNYQIEQKEEWTEEEAAQQENVRNELYNMVNNLHKVEKKQAFISSMLNLSKEDQNYMEAVQKLSETVYDVSNTRKNYSSSTGKERIKETNIQNETLVFYRNSGENREETEERGEETEGKTENIPNLSQYQVQNQTFQYKEENRQDFKQAQMNVVQQNQINETEIENNTNTDETVYSKTESRNTERDTKEVISNTESKEQIRERLESGSKEIKEKFLSEIYHAGEKETVPGESGYGEGVPVKADLKHIQEAERSETEGIPEPNPEEGIKTPARTVEEKEDGVSVIHTEGQLQEFQKEVVKENLQENKTFLSQLYNNSSQSINQTGQSSQFMEKYENKTENTQTINQTEGDESLYTTVQTPVTVNEKNTQILEQIEKMDSYNREIQKSFASDIQKQTYIRDIVPDMKKTRMEALKALTDPQVVIQNALESETIIQNNEERLMETLYENMEPETRQIIEIARKYQKNPGEAVSEGLVHTGSPQLLQAEINRVEREQQEIEKVVLKHEGQQEKMSRTADGVIEEVYHKPAGEVLRREEVPEYQAKPLSFVHKQEAQPELPEDMIEQLERTKQKTIIKEETTEEKQLQKDYVTETQINEMKQDMMRKTSQDIAELIDSGIRKQMNAISGQVYSRLEKKLKGERSRRGL